MLQNADNSPRGSPLYQITDEIGECSSRLCTFFKKYQIITLVYLLDVYIGPLQYPTVNIKIQHKCVAPQVHKVPNLYTVRVTCCTYPGT